MFLKTIGLFMATKVIFQTGNCTFKHDVFSNFSMEIINSKVKIDIYLVGVLKEGLKGHLSFEVRQSKSTSYQSVFQHDINYCALLKGSQNSIYSRWYNSMLKTGNFARSCPIYPGYYYIQDWELKDDLVPTFLFFGDYRIAASFYYGKYSKRNKLLVECLIEALLS
ncbi:PREDICTED: uncharacterized protein LOC108612436 [Drosophila arizonae]|uniref:Uncharacterized protein LOC108612436 n=1 Tax=Drosophila arizonae TaxID=7263 RepID=A0ABM1P0S0_DROAR|nr:PREDICTED: uncharacterized protein LOC108612436 [Drosophila arizonae]